MNNISIIFLNSIAGNYSSRILCNIPQNALVLQYHYLSAQRHRAYATNVQKYTNLIHKICINKYVLDPRYDQ